ncbi:MAG: ABC transporter ATP-binding protein [Cycloclasticus sp.]|nr:ABC transporter ATP-binding protein [Cycloclasticus sp.]
MTIAIKVENLSKKYIISHEKKTQGYKTLSESLMQGGQRIANKIIHPFSQSEIDAQTQEEFWALKDINFEINQGDKVGIIGRNGAGKSTLLKVLSRITDPTSGKIHINGRIASLLEVGTGFHPELTGRENIYLNGAILGMSRKEIKLKFDDIVAFAEVDKFLDTPVKRYSSGMYVRLAFAVAAHLESEILVIDEVLAVGDAQFQKKCLGKMDDVSKAGRTILFVSHNMAAIQQLCCRGVLLSDGIMKDTGNIERVIESYLNDSSMSAKVSIDEMLRVNPEYGTIARIINVWPVNSNGDRTSGFKLGEDISFDLNIKAFEAVDNLSIVIGLDNFMDYRITTVLSEEVGMLFSSSRDAVISINLRLPGLHLKPGTYSLALGLRRNKLALDHVVKAFNFEISEISINHKNCNSSVLGDVLAESVWRLS